MQIKKAIACIIAGILSFASFSQTSFTKTEFKTPPNSVKLHAWWHWVDDAISKEGITRDLESMKRQGIVQATILNVSLFSQKSFGVPPVKFNSPEWYDMFRWALKEARRLNITIGAHNCDGWSSSGGPWISAEQSMKQYVWTKRNVASGGKPIVLRKPFAKDGFYRDVAVVAYKSASRPNSFTSFQPDMKVNDSIDAGYLRDGDPGSALSLQRRDAITIKFKEPFRVEKVVIHPRRQFMWSDMSSFNSEYTLYSSDDAKNFTKLKDISIVGLNRSFEVQVPATTAKFYKLVLNDHSYSDAWFGYYLSEVELLKNDEAPSFAPSVKHFLEKTAIVKSQSPAYFSEADSSTTAAIDAESVVDLTSFMKSDGTLDWQPTGGDWTVIRFGYTTTGAMNAPATREGTGLECDKMDRTALDHHFNSFSKKLVDAAREFAGNTFKFLLVDSWECGYQNWTKSFPEEFKKRRGYELTRFIPALCGDLVTSSETTEAFLYDFRKTIADLIEDNYYKRLKQLCRENKVEFHSEVIYGDANYPPLDILRSNSYVDMPMFEFWAGYNKQAIPQYTPVSRPEMSFPVYASPLYDKKVIGAEAYTGYAHYSESPSYLKAYGDRAYSSGINQLILHSYVHQPTERKPGMTLGGFAAHFNRNNPWWNFAAGWTDYQSRVQYVLQKGTTVSDVLFYVGDQLPQYVDNGFLKHLPFGYRGNACNLDLLSRATVKNGKIVLNNGDVYSLLVLPDAKVMEYETLKRIAALVRQGAVVYGPKPVAGLSTASLKAKEAFMKLSDSLWNSTPSQSDRRSFGRGAVYGGQSLVDVLGSMKLSPDFSAGPEDSTTLMYIHKRANASDVYFVFNQQNATIERECTFRLSGKRVELWDPVNGTTRIVSEARQANGGTQVKVKLRPHESAFFVFTNASVAKASQFVEPDTVLINEFSGTIDFQAEYNNKFSTVQISSLKPLNEFDDSAVKYFAGTATYRIRFKRPSGIGVGDSVMLNLGQVEATAKVRLNDKPVGMIWSTLQSLNVTPILRDDNILEVQVGTTYRNRIIGDLVQHGTFKNVWSSAEITDIINKTMDLKPTGLMGPMQFIVVKRGQGK
jgi:hypothetical protein